MASTAALLLMMISHIELRAADTTINTDTSDNVVLGNDDTLEVNSPATLDNTTGTPGPTVLVNGTGTDIKVNVGGTIESTIDGEAAIEVGVGYVGAITNEGTIKNDGGSAILLQDDATLTNSGVIIAGNAGDAVAALDAAMPPFSRGGMTADRRRMKCWPGGAEAAPTLTRT